MASGSGTGFLFTTGPGYTGNWTPDVTFPDCLALLPNASVDQNSQQISASTRQFFTLLEGTNYSSLSLADLPAGFKVLSIIQAPASNPSNVLAYNTTANPPGGVPIAFTGILGSAVWDSWDTGNLGLSSGGVTVFDPVTMGIKFLSIWNFTCVGSVPMGNPLFEKGLRLVQSSTPVDSIGDPIQHAPGAPTIVFQFTWSYDTNDCAGLAAVTNATIVDPVTGEVSWTPDGDGTIVVVESLTETQTYYFDNTITNYVPTLTGDLIITLYAATEFPICKSLPVVLNVTVTTPFVFTMGQDGISVGIYLGGTATLQFIGDPSGIYTLVPGKLYDTLYERTPAAGSQDVKIPDPYIVTSYIGE